MLLNIKVVFTPKSDSFVRYIVKELESVGTRFAQYRLSEFTNELTSQLSDLNIAHRSETVDFLDALEMCILFDQNAVSSYLFALYISFNEEIEERLHIDDSGCSLIEQNGHIVSYDSNFH
jgi:hypothetical protein